MDSIDGLVHTVTYVVDGEVVARDYCEDGQSILILPMDVEKEGFIFTDWEDQDGLTWEYDVTADHDLTLTAQYMDEADAVQAEGIHFITDGDTVPYNPDRLIYILQWCVLPETTYDKWVDFSSSDAP